MAHLRNAAGGRDPLTSRDIADDRRVAQPGKRRSDGLDLFAITRVVEQLQGDDREPTISPVAAAALQAPSSDCSRSPGRRAAARVGCPFRRPKHPAEASKSNRLLAALFGAGSVVAEVVGDTCLQRGLDPSVFARAHGLVLPACLGDIVAGALLAPFGIALVGFTGTLSVLGAGVIGYGVLVFACPGESRSALPAVAVAE